MLHVVSRTIARADFVLARTAPGTALLSDAPGALGDVHEMDAFNDPPPRYEVAASDPPPHYEAPDAAIEPQQERYEPNESDL